MKLEPVKLEQELALGQTLNRIFHRNPAAAVPHDHRTGSVIPLRNQSLEIAILQGMILYVDREPFIRSVVRRALGHRPGTEHAVHLQPEIEMQPASGMLVDDEQAAICFIPVGYSAGWLGVRPSARFARYSARGSGFGGGMTEKYTK